jgi:hypothetical protein
MSNIDLVQINDRHYETPDHRWAVRYGIFAPDMWLLCGPDEFEVQVDSLSDATRVITNFEKAQRYRQGTP